MMNIKRLPEFDDWFVLIKDPITKARLTARLKKASFGNLGDIRHVGFGVSEMREHFGPGWRMFYVQQGAYLIVMLGGSDKSNQKRNIAKAIELSKSLEN